MRKLATIIGAVVIIVGVASAVPMNGKIGFGIGAAPGASILEPSFFSMRIGVLENLAVEPTIEYSSDATDDKVDTVKTTDTNIGVSVRALFAFLKNEKSNLYGTFGFGVGMPKTVEEDYSVGNPYTITTSGMSYGVFLGVALEHFIAPNFSVCVSSEGGYTGISSKTEAKTGTVATTTAESSDTDILVGNTSFSLMFFWYL